MSLNRVHENYYTAQEAMAVLGMTRDSFNYYVKIGKIRKTLIPPKKHGVYAKEEIDRLALLIDAAMIVDESMNLEFRRAMIEDIDAENYLAYLNFGARANIPETRAARRRFLEVNPDITYHLYDRGKLVASMNLVPLKHEAILEFREGKRGWLFSTDMIEQFAPGKPLECIIIDFMTTTNAPPEKRERYAAHLLMHMAKHLVDWGEQGIEVKSVHASGGTEQGRRILETAGFTLLGDRGNNRVIYELDVSSSNLRLLRTYKAALAKWKQANAPTNVAGGVIVPIASSGLVP